LDIFDERDEATALNRLGKWFENVKEAGISQFDAVVKTIKSYLYGIVNYFKYQLTNAASEAFNTKINVSYQAQSVRLPRFGLFQAEDPSSLWEVILKWEKCPFSFVFELLDGFF